MFLSLVKSRLKDKIKGKFRYRKAKPKKLFTEQAIDKCNNSAYKDINTVQKEYTSR